MSTVSSIATSITTLEVRRPISRVVQVTSQGPQGPAFISQERFNNTAIGALTSGDIGKVLEWDGSSFTPTNELDTGLTITGGAF